MKIPTVDSTGKPNGYVIPIWNANEEPELRPDQVYLTAVAPHSHKGPHLHKVRSGLFCCIKGNVRIVWRCGLMYISDPSGEDYDYQCISIRPGTPACIYNDSDEEALVLNMPSPAWCAEDPDECPVEDWNPPV